VRFFDSLQPEKPSSKSSSTHPSRPNLPCPPSITLMRLIKSLACRRERESDP